MPLLFYLTQREVKIYYHQQADQLGIILLYVLTTSLFPLAIGSETKLLQHIAPAVIWICCLFSAILPMEKFFTQDYDDGCLDQLLLVSTNPYKIALSKIIAHWTMISLPLVLITLPLVVLYNLDSSIVPLLILTLIMGTGCLSLIGGMTCCLALGARKSSFLLPLLTFPLLTPMIIFGTLTTYAQLNQLNPLPHFELLSASFIICLVVCPFIAGAGIKLSVE